MTGDVYLLVDVQNLAVFRYVERPAEGESTRLGDDTIGLGSVGLGVAEDGVIRSQRFGEAGVVLVLVTACRKVGDVELLQGLAALTERLALGRSAPGERFGKPRNHHHLLIFEILQAVRLAIAPFECEVGRRVANLQFRRPCARIHDAKRKRSDDTELQKCLHDDSPPRFSTS